MTEVELPFLGGVALVAPGWQPGAGQPARPAVHVSRRSWHPAVVVGKDKEP
jgi:hypothetical protein